MPGNPRQLKMAPLWGRLVWLQSDPTPPLSSFTAAKNTRFKMVRRQTNSLQLEAMTVCVFKLCFSYWQHTHVPARAHKPHSDSLLINVCLTYKHCNDAVWTAGCLFINNCDFTLLARKAKVATAPSIEGKFLNVEAGKEENYIGVLAFSQGRALWREQGIYQQSYLGHNGH